MSQANTIPQSVSLLRLPSVLQRRGRQKSQHADDVRAGVFTRPLKPSSRMALWPSHEVDALIAAEIAGKSPDEIRQLVRQLEATRKCAFNERGHGGTSAEPPMMAGASA